MARAAPGAPSGRGGAAVQRGGCGVGHEQRAITARRDDTPEDGRDRRAKVHGPIDQTIRARPILDTDDVCDRRGHHGPIHFVEESGEQRGAGNRRRCRQQAEQQHAGPTADQRQGEYGAATDAVRYRASERAAPHRAEPVRRDHRAGLRGVETAHLG
jgi:hypothetical protein